ncbi:radical SAM family heme chaperone HemW [Glaciecola sp. XM2]|uniref:radical SAM family heme chaperone HemW n=1 Tax=Glaciecola sp. XM2 TaxID=1914931 RepID=UPI001BDF41EB|nr:radical SAM family heme chaperone HemW [Glaciecola sp. XM2]MBT1452418.1 radical SAM family heme chaperone HemW [Glaciecola sp. XM2]
MVTPRIPLSLYVHIPWCVQKCPYCDFNSHQMKGQIPENEYIGHVLDDLANDVASITHNGEIRDVETIFIGGGTPSLLSIEGMHRLMQGIAQRVPLAKNIEVTMEANPGTVEAARFTGFQDAGINRISIGVQSFQKAHLSKLGRIHDDEQARKAIDYAKQLGLRSFNTDLMHGLPEQSIENALSDLKQSIGQEAPHISWYQLTIEPNTLFYSKPPVLPTDDVLWDIQLQGQALLAQSGYQQYEISAYSKPGHQCQHNLNYWRFGDYLGIGCGAHAKITDLDTGIITRSEKVKHPKGYMDLAKPYLYKQHRVLDSDMAFEFFMNRFRLIEPCIKDEFEWLCRRTLNESERYQLTSAVDQNLLEETPQTWQVTELGRRYLNTLLSEFV